MTSNNFAQLAARGGLDGAFLEALAAPDGARRLPTKGPPEGSRTLEPGAILRPDNATPSAATVGPGGPARPEFASGQIKPEGPATFKADAGGSDGGRPLSEGGAMGGKVRNRRASDGGYLSKTDGKRVSGGELRCDTCGKGYKHSSCLTKHLSVALIPFSPRF